MNRFQLLFLTFCLLFVFTACTDDEGTTVNEVDPPSDALNKIMPLGASRVEGARPVFESYRYELWKLMLDGNYSVDYIGTMEDESNYPTYAGQSFDDDHEGRGGWTSGQILDGINNWLDQIDTPDIVLFSSPGGNDALENLPYEDAISNINAIIDALQAKNANVTILIEQLAPARSELMVEPLRTYFNRMQADVVKIANEQSTASSTVIPVDMASGFNDAMLADDVHYNETGAKFIATRYYDVLINLLQN